MTIQTVRLIKGIQGYASAVDVSWALRYVALPYKDEGMDESGVDCRGLVKLVLAREKGIEFPPYHGYSVQDLAAATKKVDEEKQGSNWYPVMPEGEMPFDVVLLSEYVRGPDGALHKELCHMGIVTKPGWILHAVPRHGVLHMAFRDIVHMGVRAHTIMKTKVFEIYRHRHLANSDV